MSDREEGTAFDGGTSDREGQTGFDGGEGATGGEGSLYVRAMDRVIDQAADYMGRERAVEIANSVPLRVDEDGEIREFEFGDTEESMRAVAQLLLEAYVRVVGRQLVVNMLRASVSGQQLRTLENLCPSDGVAAERRGTT